MNADESRKVTMVVPTIPKDLPTLVKYLDVYFELLPIKSICVVGDQGIKKLLPQDDRVCFLDEESLLNTDIIKSTFSSRCNSQEDNKRCGWYIQQFLKMAYSRVCVDDYYLLWDSDTIPVKRIDLFDEKDRPYLDYKTEYCKDYFETIGRLLPGYKKSFKGSFIAEHMLVSTLHMRDLIEKIESNSDIDGCSFGEKVINAVDKDSLPKSGFSEFETFGTFIYNNYTEQYTLRRWTSLRHGAFFYPQNRPLRLKEREWLSQYFHAVSFEKKDRLSLFNGIVNKKLFMTLFSPAFLIILELAVRGSRKLFKC